MNIFYVYILRRPDYYDPFYIWLSCPFYVGKGSNGRIKDHNREATRELNQNDSKTIKIKIIHKLWRNLLDYEEEILFDNLTEQEAFEIEIKLIAKYGRINNETGCLANLTDGGEGSAGIIISEETKKKMSDNHKEIFDGENNPFYGKHHTEESKKKQSEATRKYFLLNDVKFSEEHKNNLSISITSYHKKQKLLKEKIKFEACGHEDWEQCKFCKQYDDPINFFISKDKKNIYHRECQNKYIKKWRDLKKEGKPKLNHINGRAKITPDDVREIRELRKGGLSYQKIANIFNITWTVPYKICVGDHWKWVE